MPHRARLQRLAKNALRGSASVTAAASQYWEAIARDRNLPDKPYPMAFRKTAFSVWGQVSSGSTSRGSKTSRSRR